MFFETSVSTLKDRESGFWAGQLPKTLQDAIEIVRRLGLEWIWIDSLCILQRDVRDWSHESSLMAQVYGNAAFTISADWAWYSNQGILKERDLPRSHAFGADEGLCLQRPPESWDTLYLNPLNQRGWTLQERLLSRRNLHFRADQLAWECNSTIYSEAFRGRSDRPPGQHFGKGEFSPFLHQTKANTDKKHTAIDLIPRLFAWNRMAQEVTFRHFSVKTDKLPAMSGVASAIQVPELGEYFAGVWSFSPWQSMTWFPLGSMSLEEKQRGPSWSWQSVREFNQMHWYHVACDETITQEQLEKWQEWSSRYEPKLLDKKIICKTKDPKGSVEDGSYIVVSGWTREIFIKTIDRSNDGDWQRFHERWFPIFPAISTQERSRPGLHVHMDLRPHDCAATCSFTGEFSDVEGAVYSTETKRYICLQIARDKKLIEYDPKIVALVLEKIDSEEGGYRRAGLLAFDTVDEGAWTEMNLKLV
ncbi:hypothetical protein N0V90_012580 [Kalmusia sp. IMI 367209]|nr:hypothetical protein N0V90_012580 [Kalmusia sp. IMI 367209]